VLEGLYAGAREDARIRQRKVSLDEIERLAKKQTPAIDAHAALAPAESMKVIAEVKRASPSRGDLAEIAEPQELARQYETGGASAISVLTEQRKFKGSLTDLERVKQAVSIPVLRKDFISEPYQVLEARASGADIVLLIVAGLEDRVLQQLFDLTHELGMSALVEAHSADEVARAVDLGAQLIGVNARNLKTFEMDRELFGRVADQIPAGVTKIAESAVLGLSDVERYRDAGANAVLIGEGLVTGDATQKLKQYTNVKTL
jgi:indole-3-glycerol phosphate synthase